MSPPERAFPVEGGKRPYFTGSLLDEIEERL